MGVGGYRANMLSLQGQKMTAITQYKIDKCEATGNQRYKHTIIVDLKGTGMSLLGGKKRGIIQRVFGVGGDYFPESVWKIYVVNTPFVFRVRILPLLPHRTTIAAVAVIPLLVCSPVEGGGFTCCHCCHCCSCGLKMAVDVVCVATAGAVAVSRTIACLPLV